MSSRSGLKSFPERFFTIISRLPLLTEPIITCPLISERTAGLLLGLRASKSSVTRGRPPVISLALPNARGILMMMSPTFTSVPSSTITCAPTGRLYCLMIAPVTSTMSTEGLFVLSLDSMMTLSLDVENSSTESLRYVTPSIIFSNLRVPATSTIVVALYASHSQIRSPFFTMSPSLK